jgi:hypothetical protein
MSATSYGSGSSSLSLKLFAPGSSVVLPDLVTSVAMTIENYGLEFVSYRRIKPLFNPESFRALGADAMAGCLLGKVPSALIFSSRRTAVQRAFSDDQVMFRIDRDLHIVADHAGAAATGRHRAAVGISRRDLLMRLFALSFALEQLHHNLIDLTRCVREWAGDVRAKTTA